MSDLQRALSTGSDYDIDEYLSMVGPKQFREEVEELAQPSSTMRDQFAMAALTGLLAQRRTLPEDMDLAASLAYTLADAMLKAREGSSDE
jgi:hypothetical protein